MKFKSWLAASMLLLTCAWAAWLFGSVDCADAQKENVPTEYVPDTATFSLTGIAESTEKSMRGYLQEAERVSSASAANVRPSPKSRRPNLFGTSGRSSASTGSGDGLEVIYLDSPKNEERVKAVFPADKYKLTGLIYGTGPATAFILDIAENKSFKFHEGDRIANGTIKSISSDAVVVTGDFGQAILNRR